MKCKVISGLKMHTELMFFTYLLREINQHLFFILLKRKKWILMKLIIKEVLHYIGLVIQDQNLHLVIFWLLGQI